MRIMGKWRLFEDGATRPVVEAFALDGACAWTPVLMLVDIGADRTVFAASVADELRLPATRSSAGVIGLGGWAESNFVETTLKFICDEGKPATVRGEMVTLRDAEALDMSMLGRDVLNNFDVIVSYRRKEVLLLAERHSYQVIAS